MAYGEGFVLKIAGRPCWYYEIPGKPPIRRSTKIPVLPANVKPKDVAKEEEKSRKLAERFLEALKGKHESGEQRFVPVGSSITVAVLIERFLEDIRLQLMEGGKSHSTYNTYRGQADNHLKPHFGT